MFPESLLPHGQEQAGGTSVTDNPAFWVLSAAIFAVNTMVVVLAGHGSLLFVLLALVAIYGALAAGIGAATRRARQTTTAKRLEHNRWR